MTLQIDVDCIGENGETIKMDLGLGGHLMGFESYRYDFWAASVMKELGLNILPIIAKQAMVYVVGDELEQLKQEAMTIQANLSLVMEHTPPDEQFIMHRTNNVIHAVHIAKECGGHVTIG